MRDQSERIVPHILLGDTRRRILLTRVRTAVERWRRTWAADPDADLHVEIHDNPSLGAVNRWSDASCFRASAGQGIELRFLVPPSVAPHLIGVRAKSLEFSDGAFASSSLAGELEVEVIRALARELLDPVGSRAIDFELLSKVGIEQWCELQLERYSAALITLDGERAALNILLSPVFIASIVPGVGRALAGEPLERRMSGAVEQTVAMEELLGHAEVSVAELARLSVGDVIVLAEPLSSGGELLVADGGRVGSTTLGSSGGRRAVQLRALQMKGKSR